MAAESATKPRVSFEVTPEMHARLAEISKGTSLSVTDVMRRAVALIDYAYDAKQCKQRLGILDADRNLVTEITNVL